jgi:hypothetical protein
MSPDQTTSQSACRDAQPTGRSLLSRSEAKGQKEGVASGGRRNKTEA